ncbi:MAG: TIGR04255 family protein, partial [Gemmataceae bacterium]|nr:TIGR04255 family protein [Gemmataceae bacterium]
MDFQVELPKGFAACNLEKCQDPVKAEYPIFQPLKHAFGKFELGDQVTASATSQEIGYRFVSADGLQLFQARKDGFTHNRLAPYLGWEPFRTEARRLWSVYREVAKPVSVKRVAVRYINRIDIPLPGPELKEYLRTSPEVSPALPQGMASFFMQVTLPVDELKG